MIPVNFEEVGDPGFHGDGDAHGVDEFAAIFGDAFGSEDGAFGVANDFHVAAFGFHEDGSPVVVEGEIGDEEIDAIGFERVLTASCRGQLGVGEDDGGEGVVVNRSDGAAGGVARGEFALEHGGVDNFVRASAIAAGADDGIGGALHGIAADMAAGEGFDADGVEPEVVGGGAASERIDEIWGAD